MEDWAEIRRLYRAERLSIKAIARRLGISRNTVRKAVVSSQPPRYVRKRHGWVNIHGLMVEELALPPRIDQFVGPIDVVPGHTVRRNGCAGHAIRRAPPPSVFHRREDAPKARQ